MLIEYYYPQEDENAINKDYYFADQGIGHTVAYDFVLRIEPYDSTNLKISGYVTFQNNITINGVQYLLAVDPTNEVSISGDVTIGSSSVDRSNADVTIVYFKDTIIASCSKLNLEVDVFSNWHNINSNLKLYKVTFANYNNVCSGTFNISCYHGQQITAPKQVKEPYQVSWYEKNGRKPSSLIPEETFIFDGSKYDNLSYGINCYPYSVSVVFDCTGGVDEYGIADNNGTYNAEKGFAIPSNVPTGKEHTFLFWSTEKNGEGKIYYPRDSYIFTKVEEHVILYANWVRNGIIVFKNNEIAANSFITSDYIGIDENDNLYAPNFINNDTVMFKKDGVYAKNFISKPTVGDISEYTRGLLISSDGYTFTDINGLRLYASKEEE